MVSSAIVLQASAARRAARSQTPPSFPESIGQGPASEAGVCAVAVYPAHAIIDSRLAPYSIMIWKLIELFSVAKARRGKGGC